MRELNRNELILLKGILYTKRMYRGMKHIPHGAVIWEEWMEDTLKWVKGFRDTMDTEDMPDWK